MNTTPPPPEYRLPAYRSLHLHRYHPYPQTQRPRLVMTAREGRQAVPRPIFLLVRPRSPDVVVVEFTDGWASWGRIVVMFAFVMRRRARRRQQAIADAS
ncbi:hypothetical protein BC629DRAFT_551910 [Irpex lacteus]|nr:hypothetical protein BC629DRAFT_551910 [Irpex lacteus]